MGKFADQDHINMYDAKKSVYKGVIGMLFDDYKNGNKMGHAVSLLGLNVLNYDKTNMNLTTYIGVSSDGTDVAEGYHLQQYHFIVVPNLTDQVTTTTTTDDNGTYTSVTILPGRISDASTWEKANGTTTLANPYDETAVKEKLTKAQEATSPLKRRLMKRLTRSRQLTLSLLKPNKNSQAPKATCLLSKQL